MAIANQLRQYSVGTQPLASYHQVTLVAGAWTQLWAADTTRSFANVVGGSGIAPEKIYVTANPAALITDTDVATLDTAAINTMYFETRGQNALYARLDAANTTKPLLVRTQTVVQVSRSPQPSGTIGVKDYSIVTACGVTALTYLHGALEAQVIAKDPTRLRATIWPDGTAQLQAGPTQRISDLDDLTPQVLTSVPFFPNILALEGIDEVRIVSGGTTFAHAYWMVDKMVALP